MKGKLFSILLVWMVGLCVWAQPQGSFLFDLPDGSEKAGYPHPVVFRENTPRLLPFYDHIQLMDSSSQRASGLPEEFLVLCHEKGLHLELFDVDGATAFILLPRKPARGNPWVWYAPTVDRQPKEENFWYFEILLKKGITVAGYHLGEVRGSPASSARFSVFYQSMTGKGYAIKPVLLGQSRGGLMMLAWAMRNPDKVKAFAGIFPVCNLTNWPLKNSKEQVLADYGLSETELLQNLSQYNPVDNLHGLAQNHVPMFVVHGDEDKLVPFEENSGLLKKNYNDLGGRVVVELIPGEGHKVTPSFFESKALLRFVIKQSRSF